MEWCTIFRSKFACDIEDTADWLAEKLDRTKHSFQVFMRPVPRIIIYSKDKDLAWKVSEWVRHRNPTGKLLFYSVVAFEGTRMKWASWCPKCRLGEGSHEEHTVQEKGEEAAER